MSAIVGIYRMDGATITAENVRVMIESMPHRSPDGHAVWHAGPVGLGHGMLFTTPESLDEELPLTSVSGRCTLTADARIDNRDELSTRLGRSRPDRSLTDSDLILAAYERWGEDCVDHLLGDFAFAVWDAQERRLFCARDHFGIRPLYYHVSHGRQIVFASEIKALLTQKGVPNRINEVRLAEYLAGTSGKAAHTLYEGIHRLPAGHALSVDEGGLRIRRYYELQPSEEVGSDWTDEAYEERFRELFDEAVRCRTRSAFPVASELSGGLDSTYVTCVARNVLQEEGRGPLHTLSGIYENVPECDERRYIRTVLHDGGLEPHLVPLDADGPLTRLKDIYDVLDDGCVGNNHQISWALRRAGRDADIRVLLDGHDGDYTVGHGRSYLRMLASAGRWEEFVQQVMLSARLHERADHRQPHDVLLSSPAAMLRAYAIRDLDERAEAGQWVAVCKAVRALARMTDLSASFYLKRYLRKLIVPRRLHALKMRLREKKRAPIPDLIDDSFAARVGLDRTKSTSDQTYVGDEREEQRRLLSSDVFAQGLEISNHYAAAHGIELRHPFLDKRLVEFCLALPLDQSFRNGWTRWIMRKSMEAVAPAEVAWRIGKANLRQGFVHGLLTHDAGRLREAFESGSMLDGLVDLPAARHLFDRRDELGIDDLVALCRAATVSSLLKAKSFSDIRIRNEVPPEVEKKRSGNGRITSNQSKEIEVVDTVVTDELSAAAITE